MSYTEITPRPVAVGAPVKISLAVNKFGNRTFRISLNAPAQAEFGVAAGDKLRVMIGSAADAGKIILAPEPEGPFEIMKSLKTSVFVRVPATDWAPQESVKVRPCKYEIDAGEMHLTLPLVMVVGGARPTAAVAAPAEGGRDMTAALMGDPKPGRSARR